MKKRLLKYLKGEMNPSDKSFFEHELMRDELVNQIEKLDVLEMETLRKVRRISIKWEHLVGAAMVLVLIGWVSFVFHSINSKISDENIFASYYQPYKSHKVSRIFFSKNKLMIAWQLYNEGNFPKAINELKSITISDTTNSSAFFLLGLSLIEKQNFKEAIKNLTYVIDRNDNSSLIEPTEWYLALCYLKIQKRSEAVNLLNELSDKYYYQNKAEDLLRKIK